MRIDVPNTPFKTVRVHFETKEDVAEFARQTEQRITASTKECWWPKAKVVTE